MSPRQLLHKFPGSKEAQGSEEMTGKAVACREKPSDCEPRVPDVFGQPFSRCLLPANQAPGIFLGTGDTGVNKTNKMLAIMELAF